MSAVWSAAMILAGLSGACATTSAASGGASRPTGDRAEAEHLVLKARMTLDDFMADPNMGAFRDTLRKAKGVLIVPELISGGVVVGGSGGSGVLLVRDPDTGAWSAPAFYTLGGVSFGLQVGAEASEVAILAMTDRGVASMLTNSLELGGDVGFALGPYGSGAAAATGNLSADLLGFSRSKGIYGGIAFDGAVLAPRAAWNRAYYGRMITTAGLLIKGEGSREFAMALIEDVTRSACTGETCAPDTSPKR